MALEAVVIAAVVVLGALGFFRMYVSAQERLHERKASYAAQIRERELREHELRVEELKWKALLEGKARREEVERT